MLIYLIRLLDCSAHWFGAVELADALLMQWLSTGLLYQGFYVYNSQEAIVKCMVLSFYVTNPHID